MQVPMSVESQRSRCPISKREGGGGGEKKPPKKKHKPWKAFKTLAFGMNLPCVMPCFYKLVLEMCVMYVAAETGSHSLVCFLLVIIILANFPYNLLFLKWVWYSPPY